jgi:hypothetical protein
MAASSDCASISRIAYHSREIVVSASISRARTAFTRVNAVITFRQASEAGVALIFTGGMPGTLEKIVA